MNFTFALLLLSAQPQVESDGNIWPQHEAVELCIQEKMTPRECAILVKGIEWREMAIQRTHQLAQCEETFSRINAAPAPSLWDHIPSILVVAGAALGAGLVLGYVGNR